jgi:hypothetical protein
MEKDKSSNLPTAALPVTVSVCQQTHHASVSCANPSAKELAELQLQLVGLQLAGLQPAVSTAPMPLQVLSQKTRAFEPCIHKLTMSCCGP